VLDRSDLDELCASEPGILMDIMGSIARRLRSTSESYQDQWRREVEDRLLATRSLQSRLADQVLTRGGTWQALLLFALALGLWTYLGQHGIPRFGLRPFDPAPFRMLNLILGALAAVAAPAILLVLNRLQEEQATKPRGRDRIEDRLKEVRGSLERSQQQLRSRLARASATVDQRNREPVTLHRQHN
jgi:uncharacterized membrane protein